ncbi:MAG TPA: DUF6445 family protein [Methylotenera sp.]|nr:DUF6445 family protein [Methylotenera sp.]
MNLYPVTIIENFYENPAAIRKFALAQKYTFCKDRENLEYVYPGSRTKDIFDLDKNLHEKICKKLVSVFHNSEYDYMRWAISTSFQSVTEEYGKGVIHTDQNTIFAAVLYLTPDAPLDTGTSLFRKNGKFDEKKYLQALATNDTRFRDGQIVMDTTYHDMFDEIVRVNNVYNTLIIYEGRHFHAANEFFGKNLKDSRLAQVFFINKIDAQRHSSFPLHRTSSIKI